MALKFEFTKNTDNKSLENGEYEDMLGLFNKYSPNFKLDFGNKTEFIEKEFRAFGRKHAF